MVTTDEAFQLRVRGKREGLILKPGKEPSEIFYFRTGYLDFSTEKNLIKVYNLLEMAAEIAKYEKGGEHHVFLDSVVNREELVNPRVTFTYLNNPSNKRIFIGLNHTTLEVLLRENGFDIDKLYKNK